ncbi:TIMELESS-interacting protein [Trichonephila inaurata madagascariensis]|uniref:TIMELESS-interacting protein n=1 Tax=Trichonephila inaurata madagascariensis TaxID=2747483 RepID=A0A8X6Y5H3_9ARAC|nr:TIMELESS-interacting protein [Trichonephila inaurata madagascariensis]
MAEDEDDLDNLFEEYESNAPQTNENVESNQNAENEAAAAERVPVQKRIVKNPRVKFNPERLCGKRGIPILANHFKDVKFKGKGHEKEDLKKLLNVLELWTHRLFPSMKFEDCLRQIEKLGKKRPVQTCLQKIRLDMPLLNYDVVHDEDEKEEERENEMTTEPPAQDAFDQLFDDYQASTQPGVSSENPQVAGTVLGTSFGSSLTEEQKKRMEYNKLLATERRKARLAAMQNTFSDGDNTGNEDSTLLLQSSNSEFDSDRNNTSEALFNSQPSNDENRDNSNDNSQSLFDNLFKQSADKNSSTSDELKFESHPMILDHPKDSEELGLDELMDLVDEQPKDSEVDLDESAELVGKEQLKNSVQVGLDESIHLVDEEHHKSSKTLGFDKLKDSVKEQPKAPEVECDKLGDLVNKQTKGSKELGLDELMDLVEEKLPNDGKTESLIVDNDSASTSDKIPLLEFQTAVTNENTSRDLSFKVMNQDEDESFISEEM